MYEWNFDAFFAVTSVPNGPRFMQPKKRSSVTSLVRTLRTLKFRRGTTKLLLAFHVACAGCAENELLSGPEDATYVDASTPTFNRDIAPIIFSNCSSCHRPGESAPFSLLTYDDVVSHRQQIVDATQSRYMPPWPPEPGHLPFHSERRLSDDQLAKIAKWVQTGAAEGDPADLPATPKFTSGWQLGKPDLVLEMDRPYTVAAGGGDVFRNFIIPVSLPKDRYVAAYEFRSGNPRVVHHADIRTDPTGGMRELDTMDDEPGFDGLLDSSAAPPGGVFLGWTPGRVPMPANPKISWPLQNGVDLIFQLHLQPTGKPESIQSSIGLYFADQPPEQIPYTISLGCRYIDIPPGVDDYTIERSYKLPVDAHVLSIYPHAHYLGKHIQGWATFPDGKKQTLIEIKDWNFNWQDQYSYREPLYLPAGTEIAMRYVYDNSAKNSRNPHNPPQRVTYGPRSINEMGELNLQLILDNQDDFQKLDADIASFQLRSTFSDLEQALANDPESVLALGGLAAVHIARSEPEQAARYLSREIELREDGFDKAKALMQLAVAHHQLGKFVDAEKELRQATSMAPRLARAWYLLGDLLSSQGRFTEALDYYERGLERDPNNVKILEKVGAIRLRNNDLVKSKAIFQRILEVDSDNFEALFNLGAIVLREQNAEAAVRYFEAAIQSRPNVAQTHNQLGIARGMRGELEKATLAFEEALKIDGNLADAHANLAMVHEQLGRHELAARHYRRRLELPDPPVTVTVKLAWVLATSPDEAVRDPDEAVRLAELGAKVTERRVAIVLDRLAAAYAAGEDFQKAISTAEEALQLAKARQQVGIVEEIESRLALYRQKQPYRQPAVK
jgi:tetratricopeptide (TPR) repeat protein/mono/diheme cytochrome c family protein